MIAYLIKNWKLFLDIAIVVGGIIVFTLLDPFGMFSKRTLKGTANLVSGVKDIGELVTAEYYGEVLSSLNETFIFDIPEDTVTYKFEECIYELKRVCRDAVVENLNRRNFVKNKNTALDSLRTRFNKNEEYVYNHLIVMLAVNMIKPDEDKFFKEKKQELQNNAEQRVIKRIFNQIEDIIKTHKKNKSTDEERDVALEAYINEIPVYIESSANFHYQLNKMALSNKERRHDIVFIGRGWVKAGYKFETLDEHNFAYDEKNKLIRFYGLSPIVLDKDINPWFVPENKIKGFELVDFYNGATFEEAKIVKKRCKEKLLDQAYNAGILKQAQENGEEALKNFFALLLDEPNLKVEFHPLPYQNELNLIASDTLVTIKEALLIDSLLTLFENKISTESKRNPAMSEFYNQQRQIFYNQLKNLYFIDSSYNFNIYSIEAAKLLKNKHFILKSDYNDFKKIRDTLQLIQISRKEYDIITRFTTQYAAFTEYPDFVSEFNQTLDCIDRQLELALKDTLIMIVKEKLDSLRKNENFASELSISGVVKNKLVGGDSIYFLERKADTLSYKFNELSYPVYTNDITFYKDYSFSDSLLIKHKLDSIADKGFAPVQTPYDGLRKNELYSVIVEYNYQKIKRELTLKPIHEFIDVVKNSLN